MCNISVTAETTMAAPLPSTLHTNVHGVLLTCASDHALVNHSVLVFGVLGGLVDLSLLPISSLVVLPLYLLPYRPSFGSSETRGSILPEGVSGLCFYYLKCTLRPFSSSVILTYTSCSMRSNGTSSKMLSWTPCTSFLITCLFFF